MEILLYIIFIFLGFVIGSFLNVVIDRVPLRKSVISPASHCDSCGVRLSALDLVPVFSYLILGGRCRYCGVKIPWRVLIVEVISGLVFALSYWRFAGGLDTPNYTALFITAFWCCIFIIIIFIDWEHKLILNRITYPAAILALVLLGIATAFPEAEILGDRVFIPDNIILSGIIGGAVGFAFFFIVFLINPGAMGMGDIKLALLIGLVTGFPLVIAGLMIGILVGGLTAIILLVFKIRKGKDVIPYGTFLGIGPIVAFFWGNQIIDWYLGFF
jgi:prepilin signal peptidase PulO-like enzyme (type II secretory pathway)